MVAISNGANGISGFGAYAAPPSKLAMGWYTRKNSFRLKATRSAVRSDICCLANRTPERERHTGLAPATATRTCAVRANLRPPHPPEWRKKQRRERATNGAWRRDTHLGKILCCEKLPAKSTRPGLEFFLLPGR